MTSNSKYAIDKTLFTVTVIMACFVITLIYLSNSWIKLATLGLILGSSVIWLASRGLLRRAFKFVVVVVLFFALSFSAFEGYMFWNAGYPPTVDSAQSGVTISRSNILNVSLTEIVQSIKNTSTFKFLMLEYPGEVKIETITLRCGDDGAVGIDPLMFNRGFRRAELDVLFYQESSNLGFNFGSSRGSSYHVSINSLIGTGSNPMFHQYQTQDEIFKQIDRLGLQWYYDCAIEACKNKNSVTPEINQLVITIQSLNDSDYQGTRIVIIGWQGDNDYVFSAYFHPDGTLNYLSTAT